MEAKITVSASPAEFDKIRAALQIALEDAAQRADRSSDPATKRAARAESVGYVDLLAKLR